MDIMNSTIKELIAQGIITQKQVEDMVGRAARASARNARAQRRAEVKETVAGKVAELLAEAGAAVKHRTVWEAVGRSEHSRDEVLTALRTLRDEGVLQNIRASSNNFQVFWALAEQPDAPDFGTVEDIDADEA